MALQGTDTGALKSALREILATDRAHPDTFNPILQDLINNDVTLEALARSYTDQQIQLVTESGVPKLVSYQYVLTSTIEDQTDFVIPLQTFDKETDTVIVSQNRTFLEPTAYTVNNTVDNKIVLVNGVTIGTDIHLMILKNVAQGPEGSINGGTLAVNSIPVDRLQDFNAGKVSIVDLSNEFTATNIEEALVEINNKVEVAKDTIQGHKTIKSDKDSNGVYTTVTLRRRSDDSLFATSILSGGTSPNYTTRTYTEYEEDGLTVRETIVYTLSYDSDGVLVSEV